MKGLKRGTLLISLLFLLSACTTKTLQSVDKGSTEKQEITKTVKKTSSSAEKEQKAREQVEKTAKEAEEKKIQELTSTDDAAKYELAYQEYTEKGNPMPPEQRGVSGKPSGFFESVGLTIEDYNTIFWGIYDYYGSAIKASHLTEEKGAALIKEAHDRLIKGDYAKKEIVPMSVVTLDNAPEYAQQYFDKASLDWQVVFFDVTQDENGHFKVSFEGQSKLQRGYILITKDRVGRRFSFGGSQLGETLMLD